MQFVSTALKHLQIRTPIILISSMLMIGGVLPGMRTPFHQFSRYCLAAANIMRMHCLDQSVIGPTNAKNQQYIIVHTGPRQPDIIVTAVVGRRPKPMIDRKVPSHPRQGHPADSSPSLSAWEPPTGSPSRVHG